MLYHTVVGLRTPATHYSSLVHHTLGCLQFRSSLPHIFHARAASPLPTPLPTPPLPRTAHAEVVAPSPHCISSITTTDPPRLGLLIRHDPPTSVVVTRACAGPYYPRTTTVSVMQKYSVFSIQYDHCCNRSVAAPNTLPLLSASHCRCYVSVRLFSGSE